MANRADHSEAARDGSDAERLDFVKKVYLIVLVQFIFTIVVVYIFVGVDCLRNFHAGHSLFALVPLGLAVVVAFIFGFSFKVRHKAPYNSICVIIFTVAFSYGLVFIASNTILTKILIGTAIAVFVALVIYLIAIFIPCDFTVCNPLLIAGLLVWITLWILYAVLRYTALLLATGCFGILVMACYLLLHNQLMSVNECKYAFHTDEHLSAAMAVYVDITLIGALGTFVANAAHRISEKYS